MEFGLQARLCGAKGGLVGRAAVTTKTSSADVIAPDFNGDPISDKVLFLGFILALGARGRKATTLIAFCESDNWEDARKPRPL